MLYIDISYIVLIAVTNVNKGVGGGGKYNALLIHLSLKYSQKTSNDNLMVK